MLEIVFLGTGSGIPSPKRNLASIWLNYTGEKSETMLWDCAEGTQRQMFLAKINFMRIDRIFITHWHADHWAGIIGLIQTMNLERRRKPLHVYGPEAERFVENILALGYWAPRFKIVPVEVPYEGGEITRIWGTMEFDVFSIPARHTVPSVMYCLKEKDKINVDIEAAQKIYGLSQGPLVGKLKEKGKIVFKGKEIRLDNVAKVKKGLKVVYTGDTQVCENLYKIAEEADLLIHDSTFEEERDTVMHASAKEAGEVAKKVKVKRLVLTHFSRRYTDVKSLEAEAKKNFTDTISAHDFMKIVLKKD